MLPDTNACPSFVQWLSTSVREAHPALIPRVDECPRDCALQMLAGVGGHELHLGESLHPESAQTQRLPLRCPWS